MQDILEGIPYYGDSVVHNTTTLPQHNTWD